MSTSPKREYHHADLRAALIEAALDLLAREGADSLSLRAVARQAGVSAMAPYRHYADKEALLAAVAGFGFSGLRAALLAADAGAPPGGALIEQAVAYVRYALDNPALFRLMFGPRRVFVHPELLAAGQTAFAVLAGRVSAETPATEQRENRALACWSLVHGLASLFLDGRITDKRTPAEEDAMTRRVAGALLAPGTRAGSEPVSRFR